MQFSLTLHYILDKRLVHSLGKIGLVIWFLLHLLQMYKRLSCTTVDKQHEKNYLWFNSENNTSIAL